MGSDKMELENWLSKRTQKNTRNIYQSSARHFLNCVYGIGLNQSDAEYEKLTDKYISEVKLGRVWFKDLEKFAVYISNDGKRPPKTAQTYLYGIKSYLEHILNCEISKKQIRDIKNILPKGTRARTQDGELTRERFRNILTHCDSKGKALFLFCASSGVRIGEVLQLLPDDIDFKTDPTKVHVRGAITKEGDAYDTFISSEAKESLVEWLKVKNEYLAQSMNRGRGLKHGQGVKDANDKRIFPFSMNVADSMWTNAIRKAGLDVKDSDTDRHKYHIHILRKFFNSQLKYANVPDDMVESMLGHSRGIVATYGRYSMEQFAEKYKKAEPYLLVNVPTEIHEMQTKYNQDKEKQKQEIDDLYRKLTTTNSNMLEYVAENKILIKKVESLEKTVQMHKEIFQKMTDMKFEEFAKWMQDKDRYEWQQQREEDKKQAEKA